MRGVVGDAEAGEVRAGGRGMAEFVAAIPERPVDAGVERLIYQYAHELALDVVDRQADGRGLAEVEAEVGGCVEGVGPNLEGVGRAGRFGRWLAGSSG